jgi:RNA polymerase sigma factor (sigma-70 family)
MPRRRASDWSVAMSAASDPPVTAYLGTEDAGFESFFATHHRAVVALVYSLSGSRAAAEDIAQDAFLAALGRWDRIRSYEEPGAWVRRVAVNKAVSRFRRTVSEAKALARLGRQRTDVAPMPATDHEFWAEVRRLPTKQAQAVALRYLEDRSTADIAAVLDCSEATVRVHLHRGRLALAGRLGLDRDREV